MPLLLHHVIWWNNNVLLIDYLNENASFCPKRVTGYQICCFTFKYVVLPIVSQIFTVIVFSVAEQSESCVMITICQIHHVYMTTWNRAVHHLRSSCDVHMTSEENYHHVNMVFITTIFTACTNRLGARTIRWTSEQNYHHFIFCWST